LPETIGKPSAVQASPMPFDGHDQLAHDLRAFGIAEIEVVGGGQRFGAGGGEVAPAFGDGLLAALEGVGLDIARRDIEEKASAFVS
jgi:hypothetical protein